MKALVTGATGFVGGHLVDRLLARGDSVTALVRSPAKAAELTARGVRLVRGDLGDHAALTEAAAAQDVIYHAAALTGAVDEAEFLAANRDGTANVVRAALAGGAPRFVLVSSMAAGGPAGRGRPKGADGHDTPVTMYGRSKLASEQVLRGAALPWVILRPPTVYGPRDRDNLITVFKAARLGIAPVFGDGSMEVSIVHVEDLADAIVLAGTAGEQVVGQTYYTNHPEVLSSADLVREIARSMGRGVTLLPIPEWAARVALTATGAWAAALRRKTILRADKANEFYQAAWTGDPASFIDATGWQPRFDAATGLAHTHDWYRQAGWL